MGGSVGDMNGSTWGKSSVIIAEVFSVARRQLSMATLFEVGFFFGLVYWVFKGYVDGHSH